MKSLGWRIALAISTLVVISIVLTACDNRANSAVLSEAASNSSETADAHMEGGDAHTDESRETEGAGHAEDEEQHGDMAAAHGIPPEEASRKNPVPVDDSSLVRGAELFQVSCAVCHGDAGHGDGVAGVALDPKPADLTADHVQGNTDGSLFYTISNGVEGTAMVAWQDQFSEEDRWHLVNFLRTLSGSE